MGVYLRERPGQSGLRNKARSASEAAFMADTRPEILRESTLAGFPGLGAAILYGNMSNFFFFYLFLVHFPQKY